MRSSLPSSSSPSSPPAANPARARPGAPLRTRLRRQSVMGLSAPTSSVTPGASPPRSVSSSPSLHFAFPKEAGDQYTFAMFDWNPAGHVPDHVYTIPHFDFHFYMAKQDDVMAISGGPDPVVAESRFVPKDYISPGNEAFPAMGVHWVDATSGEFNGKTFDQTFIWGFSRGQLLFIEPMITKAFLESTSSFTTELRQPESVQRAGLYPKRYAIRHDTAAKVYRVTLDELTPRV